MEIPFLAIEGAMVLFDAYEDEHKEDVDWNFQNVELTIINDTDLQLTRTTFDQSNIDWGYTNPQYNQRCDDPPPETINAGGKPFFMGTATWGNLAQIKGTLGYSSGSIIGNDGPINICNIKFNNTKGFPNEVEVSIAKYWYDRNYRVYFHIRRNDREFRVEVLIRRIEFPNQKQDVKAQNTQMTESPGAVFQANKIFCFHQGMDSQLFCTEFDDKSGGQDLHTWAVDDHHVSDTYMMHSPAPVAYGTKTYVFHRAGNGYELYYNALEGTKWDGDKHVDGVGMSWGPAAANYKDKIHIVHVGVNEGEPLWHSMFDGTTWTKDTMIHDTHPSETPSLMVYKDKLFCFYQGPRDGTLWWVEYDGNSWTEAKKVDHARLSNGPSACVAKDKLYVFHQEEGNTGKLLCNVYDGRAWSGDHDFLDVEMSGSPSVVEMNDTIYCFHRGGSRGQKELWCMPLPV